MSDNSEKTYTIVSGLYHGIARCMDCAFTHDDRETARSKAIQHCSETGHSVCIETGESIVHLTKKS